MTNTNTAATLTIETSQGVPSTCGAPAGSMDYDVTLTVGDERITGEVTLAPGPDAKLDLWGESVEVWASSEIGKAIVSLGAGAGSHLADQIVSACVGDDPEVTIEIDDDKIRDLGREGGMEDVQEWCRDSDREELRRMRSDNWDESAISAGVAAVLGVPVIFASAYYEGYADGAREEHLAQIADLDEAERLSESA